jgi:hypothetical protein
MFGRAGADHDVDRAGRSGDIVSSLTAREREILAAKGFDVSGNTQLTPAQEKVLRQERRKIRNKVCLDRRPWAGLSLLCLLSAHFRAGHEVDVYSRWNLRCASMRSGLCQGEPAQEGGVHGRGGEAGGGAGPVQAALRNAREGKCRANAGTALTG